MNRIKIVVITILTIGITTAFKATIDLKTKSLLNDKVELRIPAEFDIMSEELLKMKYPSERRPTLVYSNESSEINIALNLTQNQAN